MQTGHMGDGGFEGCVKLYLMYVDESGDTGYTKTPTQFFILSAIVINEMDWNFLIEDLTKFRKE
ncbi:MAG: DUF3800 domain-containing protein [Thermotogota bacterium]